MRVYNEPGYGNLTYNSVSVRLTTTADDKVWQIS